MDHPATQPEDQVPVVTANTSVSPPPLTRRFDIPGLLIALAAIAVAASVYCHFWPVSRWLWTTIGHDRAAHCFNGMRLAADVREGRIVEVVRDVIFTGAWGPFYSVLQAGVMLIAGFDYRLAVLPSLVGFVLTCLFGFLAARRAISAGGNLAGACAAVFILASPAFRCFAADIMLESVGAALSLIAVYCYLVAVQDNSRAAARWLGLALTALFFHKSNYYMLLAMSLIVGELAARPYVYTQAAAGVLRFVRQPGWLRSQLRRPFSYLLLGLVALIGLIWLRGNQPLSIGGFETRLYPPYNVLTLTYAVVFLQVAIWWRQQGRNACADIDNRIRQLILWHVWPVLISFLVPHHFRYFLGYLSTDCGRDGYNHPLLGGLPYYLECLAGDYHLGHWSMAVALGLVFIALCSWRSLRPGAGMIFSFLLIAGLLTCAHPAHRSRFLHSWIAALWVLSGIGLAQLFYGWSAANWGRLRPWLAGTAVAALAVLHIPGMLQPGHAGESGPLVQRFSWLDVTDAYLPELAGARRLTILSSVPVIRYLPDWTYIEHFRRRSPLEDHWFAFGAAGPENRGNFRHWLATTRCDTILFIERLPEATGFYMGIDDYKLHEELLDELRAQSLFQPAEQRTFPHCGCRVILWRRGAAVSGAG